MIEGVGIIFERDGKILLGKRLNDPDGEKWSLVGGRCNPVELPHEAAIRELCEETGVRPKHLSSIGVGLYNIAESPLLSHFFLCQSDDEPCNLQPREHSEIAWFDRDFLPETTSEITFSAFDLWRESESGRSKTVFQEADVLLIQPPFPFADKESLSIPLGLSGIAAVLNEDCISFTCLDGSLPCDYDAIIRMSLEPGIAANVRVVGVQFHSAMSFDWCIRFCRFLRRIMPRAHICAGGELANVRHLQLLETKTVDSVVFGEGEYSFLELCQSLLGRERKHSHSEILGTACLSPRGKVQVNATRPVVSELDELPHHLITPFRWSSYGQWTVMTSRGCPFKCMYCSSAAYWKHNIRFHSARRIYEELKRLSCDFGATDVYIADDTFTLKKSRVLELCEELIGNPLDVRWSCLTRFDCVDDRMLAKMAKAGCSQISFGLDSTNEVVLDRIGRVQDLRRAGHILVASSNLGIRTRTSIVFGLPGETKMSLRDTMQWLTKFRPNEIQIYGLTPHDGTALFGSLKKLGVRIIESNSILWSRDVLSPICETRELKAPEIVEVAHEYIEHFSRLGYIYVNDLRGKKKVNAAFTIATSFSPIQGISSIN